MMNRRKAIQAFGSIALLAPMIALQGAGNAPSQWRVLRPDELVQVGDELFVTNMNTCCLKKTGPGSYEPYPTKGPGWVKWHGESNQPTAGYWINYCGGMVKAFRRRAN